jgi:AbrB family looped-hinge helix DNA binding protein
LSLFQFQPGEYAMLVTVDKRGSINLPISIRKELGAEPGTPFEIVLEPGGNIALYPVEIYRKIRVNASGREKLEQAREAESAPLPLWFEKDMDHAGAESE